MLNKVVLTVEDLPIQTAYMKVVSCAAVYRAVQGDNFAESQSYPFTYGAKPQGINACVIIINAGDSKSAVKSSGVNIALTTATVNPPPTDTLVSG